MSDLPTRKHNRIKNFDYSSTGAYFITVCTANREPLFWCDRRGDLRSPACDAFLPLSRIGTIVRYEIQKLSTIYPCVRVDKSCIMPDHIHMIISIMSDPDGRPQVAPTIPRIINQFKGAVSKQVGRSIWQKSYYDHAIRNQQDFDETWKYIENNPLKYRSE